MLLSDGLSNNTSAMPKFDYQELDFDSIINKHAVWELIDSVMCCHSIITKCDKKTLDNLSGGLCLNYSQTCYR